MREDEIIRREIRETLEVMRAKLGVGGRTATQALPKAKRLLPGHVNVAMTTLAKAEPFLDHPKLCLTLDRSHLSHAAGEVRAYLREVDASDRRKGWWLGVLGGLSFNMLAFLVLLVVVLVWRGFL